MNIELKKWNETDFAGIGDVFTRCNRTYLSDGLPMPYTDAHAQSWYENRVKPRDGRDGLYRIIHVNGSPAGVITLECSEAKDGNAGLSYLLLDAFKGQGIMTQAVETICQEAFSVLDIRCIQARVYHPNLASVRVLEKNGFLRTGCTQDAVIKDGNTYSLMHFELHR